MSEKIFNSRIVHKHDTEANWKKATGFKPKQGEIIVYDKDSTYNYERFKIGDGQTVVSSLPFANDALEARIDNISELIGDSEVSTQIATAIENADADDFGIFVQDSEPTDAVAGDIWIDTAHDAAFIAPNLPEVTAADNGKILMVVNGRWQAVSLNLSVDANGVVSM